MGEVHKKNVRVGILEQANWATPQAASANFKIQPYMAGSPLPQQGVVIDHFDFAAQGGMHAEQARTRIDAITGLKRIPFEGLASVQSLSDHLYAAIQSVSEAAGSPYAKTYTPTSSILDFSADDGVVFTVAMDCYPSGPSDGVILENAVLDSLTLSVDNLASGHERFMKMSGVWVGNEMNVEQGLSGTLVALSPTYYNTASTTNDFTAAAATTITIDSVSLAACVRRFSLTINNNVSVPCATTGGKAGNYRFNQEFLISVDIPYNGVTYQTLSKYAAGNPIVIANYGNGTAVGTANGLGFSGTAFLTEDPFVYDGDYLAIRLNARLVKPTAGWGAIVSMSDSIDKGW